MFSSNYSIAVELLRRFLAKKGTVSIESFSDSHTSFISDGKPVVLSLNDASGDAENVTIKFGKDPHSHSVTIDMSQYKFTFPTESISITVERDFSKQIESELLNTSVFESFNNPQEKSLLESQEQQQQKKGEDPNKPGPHGKGPLPSQPSGHFNRPPDMPDFEDEYEIRGKQRFQPPQFQPTIGDADLNPAGLGGYPTLQPFLDPLAANPHGGMYPDRDHPMFGGNGTGRPRPGVPPGARYDDPYGEDSSLGMPGLGGPGLGGPGGHGGRGSRGGNGGFGGPGGSGLGGGFNGGFGGSFGPPGF